MSDPDPTPPLDDATLIATLAGEDTEGGPPSPPQLLARLLDRAAGPTRLQHYVLLDRLGEGGMGVVFAAYDEKLGRKVALKLLRAASPSGALLETKARHRLVREAQAMARLSHPNVVQIYEIGEVEGLAFIVMEFVDGVTLGAWREQQPRSQAELLGVFAAAGRGLAAAHAKGLVHRDFKPDNVMIGDDGRVLVMDFGIAREGSALAEGGPEELQRRAGASVELTATGALMGTPAYMAPEQFRGDPTDAKTDQFSFCVALWEALYGGRPFRSPTVGGLAMAVTAGEFTDPDEGDVPSWLHELLMRGLEVDRERRHGSMDELLRALADDPTYRRRGWLAGVGVLALVAALLAGARVSERRAQAEAATACEAAGHAIEADWDEARRAELGAAFSATELSFSDASWERVATRMDGYAADWSQLRTQVCMEARVEGSRDESSREQITTCLDDHRELFVALAEALHKADEQTVTHASLAAAGLPPVSSCTSDAWLAHRVSPSDDPSTRAAVIELRGRLQRVAALRLTGDFELARAEAEATLSEAEALAWVPLIAEARLQLGKVQSHIGDYEPARVNVEQAFLDAVGAGHDRVQLEAATMAAQIHGYYLAQHEVGLYWGRLGAQIIKRMGLGGTTYEAAQLTAVGHIHWSKGAFEPALESYAAALAICEASLGPEHPDVAEALANVGYARMELGDYEAALAHYTRSLELHQATLGPEHPNVGNSLTYLGDLLETRGDYEAALTYHRRALKIYEASFGPKHPAVAASYDNIGVALSQRGDLDGALASYLEAKAINEGSFGTDHPAVAASINNIAAVLSKLGDDEGALAAHQEVLRIHELSNPGDHPYLPISLNNIAGVYLSLGDYEQALSHAQRARELLEARQGADLPPVAFAWTSIGRAQLELGALSEARAAFERAIETRVEASAPAHHLAASRFGLARTLWELGEQEQATELAQAAEEGYREAGEGHEQRADELRDWRTDHVATARQ